VDCIPALEQVEGHAMRLKAEIARWGPVIREAGIRVE